jgi:hypothetical protein
MPGRRVNTSRSCLACDARAGLVALHNPHQGLASELRRYAGDRETEGFGVRLVEWFQKPILLERPGVGLMPKEPAICHRWNKLIQGAQGDAVEGTSLGLPLIQLAAEGRQSR